jgi:hypothetical protein
MDAVPVPDGFVAVSRDEFFDCMGPLNVHPSVMNPAFSSWETPSRQVIGRSYPGYKHPGDPKAFMLTTAAHAQLKGRAP